MSAAELIAVTKRFGPKAALDGVSFSVEEGQVVALLGPNGAGKSTALAVLLGLRKPDTGQALLFGVDPRKPRARRAVGVAPQEIAFPATLRVHELLELVRRHYANPSSSAALADRFLLGQAWSRQLGGLSGGERRRVAVALAFAGDPRLVVLDEPTAGLDQESRRAVWDAVRAHVGAGGAILLTTHQPGEADALAGRVVAIEAGSVVADDTAAGARAASGLVLVRFRAPPERTFPGAEREGCFLCLRTADGGAEVARLVRAGVALDDLEVRPLTLEEALAARREAEE